MSKLIHPHTPPSKMKAIEDDLLRIYIAMGLVDRYGTNDKGAPMYRWSSNLSDDNQSLARMISRCWPCLPGRQPVTNDTLRMMVEYIHKTIDLVMAADEGDVTMANGELAHIDVPTHTLQIAAVLADRADKEAKDKAERDREVMEKSNRR